MQQYTRPRTLGEALDLLGHGALSSAHHAGPVSGPTVLAGATDYFPVQATRAAWFQGNAGSVLDISAIQGLRCIDRIEGGWRIGALSTWTDLAEHAFPTAFDGLRQAARQVGGRQIQNRGTIGGNLCNASPAADGAPPLLALDAEVELASLEGVRRLPLSAFLEGNRRTQLRPDELMTAILVPDVPEGERAVFCKLGARSYLVISIASVAANLCLGRDGTVAAARITVGACSPVPQRLHRLEQALVGHHPAHVPVSLTAEDGLTPIDDVRASAAYRLEAASTLVRRALVALSAKSAGMAA